MFALVTLLSGCGAVDEGTCSDETLIALQNGCISVAGCSSSGSKAASTEDSCSLAVSILTQSGDGSCAFGADGSCDVSCECSGADPTSLMCANLGWSDCTSGATGQTPSSCTGPYAGDYEGGFDSCADSDITCFSDTNGVRTCQ